MLMNELPFVVPLFKTVRLPRHQGLRIAIFEHDVNPLNRADNAHGAVHDNIRAKDVHFARGETPEYFVEHRHCRRNASRRERGDVEPQRIASPVLGALRPRHGLAHFFDDGEESLLVGIIFALRIARSVFHVIFFQAFLEPLPPL